MSENKVVFGLKNVHYAVLTEGSTNSWATPVAIPGAVNLVLDPQESENEFYADNVVYYKSFSNNGYTGSLEIAKIPESMLADIWGESLDSTSKVYYEKTGIQPKAFALLFQVEGDQSNELYAYYRVIPGRPSAGAATTTDTVEPTTTTFNISALPLVTGSATQKGIVRGHTGEDTTSTIKSGWFSSVTIIS